MFDLLSKEGQKRGLLWGEGGGLWDDIFLRDTKIYQSSNCFYVIAFMGLVAVVVAVVVAVAVIFLKKIPSFRLCDDSLFLGCTIWNTIVC